MEYISMAQSVGDEPIRDSGWTPDDIQEWFGGDMDDARESFDYERQESLQEENDRLRKELALYRGYAGCGMTLVTCEHPDKHSSLTCYPRYLDLAGDENDYVQTADEWTLSAYLED